MSTEIEPLISVIVPFLNPGLPFNECIRSLKHQNYKNFEVILIDDGSTDGSELICKKIIEEDARFSYYRQDNKGASAARNYGIKESKGSLITFVDADDWVNEDHITTLVQTLNENNADLSCVRWKRSDRNEKIHENKKEILLFSAKDDKFQGIFDGSLYAGYVWNKLFKKSIINNYNIAFDETVKVLEDQLFTVHYMCHCLEVALNMQETYNYRIHASSIMQSSYSASHITAIIAILNVIEVLKNEKVSSQIIEGRIQHAVHTLRNNLKYYISTMDNNNIIKTSKELKDFLNINHVSLKERIKSYLLIKYGEMRRFIIG